MASPTARLKLEMISCLGLLFFLVVTVSAGPTGFSRTQTSTQSVCAPTCTTPSNGPLKFQYDLDTTYVYDFTSELETLVLEESAEKSRLKLTSSIELQVISSCDFSILLKQVHLEDGGGQGLSSAGSVKTALEKYTLRFAFQDGQIDHICSHPDEPGWVLNVKRGILSMFQNTMEDLNFNGVLSETDINGKCLTQYGPSSTGTTWVGSSTLSKFKDLSTCSNRKHQISSIQSVSYSNNPESSSISLLSGTVECTQTLLQGKIEQVECREEQIFKPFQENGSGARNVISQSVRLVTTRPQSPSDDAGGGLRRKTSSLVFELDTSFTETDKDPSQALQLLKELESKTVPSVEAEAPFLFRELVESLRTLDESSLRSILGRVSAHAGMEKTFLNGLGLANTAPSLTIMTQLYLSGGMGSDLIEYWLRGVTFIKYPSSDMIAALMPLLRDKPRRTQVLLSVSSVLNSYCRNKLVDCGQNSGMMAEAMALIAAPLLESSSCSFPEHDPQIRSAIVALKAIGNLGVYVDPDKNQLLERCFLRKKNSIEVRLAAMEAHRRISCSSFSTIPFLQVYGDYEEDTEIRIQAYLIAMKCANRKVLETVENILTHEVVNQVGSFVWTHLTNVQETNRRDKETIRNLISNEILQNKFQTDARKFSRNYENSLYSDDYNLGAGLDANIIFTEESFLPKSIMGNLSLQVFGENINFLEFGGRFNSPESLLEPIFGPEGYFPDESMATFLKSTRQKRDTTSSNRLARLDSIHDAASEKLSLSPSGSIYSRIFGHEVSYKEWHVDTESSIPNVVDENGRKWFNVKNLLDNLSTGKKLVYTKSNVLMDVDFSVPTMAGIPLTLSFLMASTTGLSAEGRFNVGKFLERKEVEIYGLLRPNLALNLDAALTLKLGPGNKALVQSGLAVRNVLRSSTAVEGRVEVNGWEGVKAVIDLPQKRQEILQVSSKIVFLQPGGTSEEKVLSSGGVDGPPRIQHQTCFGADGSNFLGLKLCGEISIPKHFTVTPLSPSVVSLYLEKTDEFEGYTIDYRLERRPSKTELVLVYDTPGSGTDRRASLNFVHLSTPGTFQARVKTPSKLLDASGGYNSNLKSLHVAIIDGNETLVQLNTSLALSGGGNKIHSRFYLEIFQKPVAELKGSIELPMMGSLDRKQGNVDITLKHVTENPIRFQGNYVGREDGSEISLGMESFYFTGNLRSNIKSRLSHWSSRSMLEYSWKGGSINTVDIGAKLIKSQKGALAKISAATSFIMSQYPDHSIDFSWETVTSSGFCENVGKFVIGKSTWDAHSIYSFQNTRDLTELRFLLALNNVRDGVDYHLEFAHRGLDRSIESKFVGRVSPESEIHAKFSYTSSSKPFLGSNVTTSVSWPGHEYSLTSALAEKRKGEFDAEILININFHRELKATISYINNSNNLKLDHMVEFRARGFFFAPVSGNVGFTVTDKLSHVGCQILIEGKKPYSSRLSTSVDYSHINNRHKIEAKVTLNERKYSSELVFGQTKNGSKHLTLDLYLNQHIYLEAKLAGSYHETITGSLLVIPDKGKSPQEKLDMWGSLASKRSLDLGLNYFGERFGMTGGFSGESANLQLAWDQGKKITIIGKVSSLTSLPAGHLSLQVTTPFESLPNLTALWSHEITGERWFGKLSGGFGEKTLLLQGTAGLSPSSAKVSGILDVSGYSRCDLNLALMKGPNLDSFLASFSRGVGYEGRVQVEHKHGRNVSSISVQLKGLHPSLPEISALWDSQQIGKHSTKFQLDWRNSAQNEEKKSLHLIYEKTLNPISYHVSLLTPLSNWKSSSLHLLLDNSGATPAYSFDMRNEVSLSILPKKLSLSLTGSLSSSFNHSADIQFSSNNSSHHHLEWLVSGHIRSILHDTRIRSELRRGLHTYKALLRSEYSQNGMRVLEIVTDVDAQKSELGLILNENEGTDENEESTSSEEKNSKIRAWGSYLSGPEKKATLLIQRGGQSRKLSLEVSEGGKSILQLESDWVWTGLRFWSVSCHLKSSIPAIPSLSLESSHNMLDTRKIVNVNSFLISPIEHSFWDVSGILWVRNGSTQAVLSNLETLYSSVKWDQEEITVAGELIGKDFGFIISSTSLFQPVNGNISYDFGENRVVLNALVTGSSSSQPIVKALIQASRSPMGPKKVEFYGTLKVKYIPTLESNLVFDQSSGGGMIETFLRSDKATIFFLHLEGLAKARNGFLKFSSTSTFYPSINGVQLDTSYTVGEHSDDAEIEVKYVKGPSTFYHLKGYGAWAEENKRLRLTSLGQSFPAEVEISLENLTNLLALASYNGRKVGQVRIRYEPQIFSTYAWGHHVIFVEFENGQGSSTKIKKGSISLRADPRKVDVTISTPFEGWSKSRLYWDFDTATAATKLAKFGLHKDGDRLDCLFDLRFLKRNETSMVTSDVSILGFKSIRTVLFGSPEENLDDEEDQTQPPYLKTISRLTAVEGTFSATAKWSSSSVQVSFRTPLERWRDLKFTGKFENGKRPGDQVTLEVSCDVNERHHEFQGTFKMPSRSRIDATFSVQCLHLYRGKLALDYAKDVKFNAEIQGPKVLWQVDGEWTKNALTLTATTPIRGWEGVVFQAKHDFTSSLQHDGSISWQINNQPKVLLGYNYLQTGNHHSLQLLSPIKSWEEVNVTLNHNYDSSSEDKKQPLSTHNVNFLAEKPDGQRLLVDINTKIIGSISNLSSPCGLSLLVTVQSPFESYKRMRLSTKYDRVGGEHSARIEYNRNSELVRLGGHFQYNQGSPHSVEIHLDLSSLQNYTSKVVATLSVDPVGNSSFTSVVEFNEAKHEVGAKLDLSRQGPVFSLETTLLFLKSLQASFRKDVEKLEVHGSWKGSDQILDVKSTLAGNGWAGQRLNLSIVSPFEGLKHIFLYTDFKLGANSLASSVLFENEEFRWLGRLEGGGGAKGWSNGRWKASANTPLKGYWQDVVLRLGHTWTPELKGLTLSLEGNSLKLLDLDGSYKSGGTLLVGFDSIILTPVSTHASIKWGTETETLPKIEVSARVGDPGDETRLEMNVQGLSSGMLNFKGNEDTILAHLTSRLAWKVDGTLEGGNGWGTLSNTILGSRSVRTSWKAKDWKNVRLETWLRLNNNETDGGTAEKAEIGGMGQFNVATPTNGIYKVQLQGNWRRGESPSGESFSINAKLGQKSSEGSSYFGEIDSESTMDMLNNFHASANLTLTPDFVLALVATSDEAQLLSLDTSWSITLPKSRISVELVAPRISSMAKKTQFLAGWDTTSERKYGQLSYKEEESYQVTLETLLLTPQQTNSQAEFSFNISSNVASSTASLGGLRGSYKVAALGLSKLSLELNSEKLGNWDFQGEIRPSSDFHLNLHLQNTVPNESTLYPILLEASWRGNFLQGISGRITSHLGKSWVNGTLALSQDSVRLSLSTPYQPLKDFELVGFLNLEQEPTKRFQVEVKSGGASYKVKGNCNMSKSWTGLGSVFISKGVTDESLAFLKFGLDPSGDLALTGLWDGVEVEVKGRIRTLASSPTTTSWMENGQIDLSLLLGGVQKLSLQSTHKFKDGEYLWNVTSGDRAEVKIRVTGGPNYVIDTSLQWSDGQDQNDVKCLVELKPKTFDIFISNPWTSDLAAHGLFDTDASAAAAAASQTRIEGWIVYDTHRSWGRLQIIHSNESLQFDVSLEVPALHQKLLLTTFLIQSPNPTQNQHQSQSGGSIAINVNGHQFGLTGELTKGSPLASNQRETQLALSFILPIKSMRKVGLQFSLRKSIHGMQNLHLNASLTLGRGGGGGREKSCFLSFGYDLPLPNNGMEGLGFNILVENHISTSFLYGGSFSMPSANLKNVAASLVMNGHSAKVGWKLNLPEVEASLGISLAPSSVNEDVAVVVNNQYSFHVKGFLDPSSVMNITLGASCKDKSLGMELLTKFETEKGLLCQAGLTLSHLADLDVDYRTRFWIRNSAKGTYELELSTTLDTIRMELTGDVVINEKNVSATGKLTGSFGSLYGRMDYSRRDDNGRHEILLSLESPTLLAGKKVVIRGELIPTKNGLDLNLQCRTRTFTHALNLHLVADPEEGQISIDLPGSPQLKPINLGVSWKKSGSSKFEGSIRANFEDFVNELETSLDIENLEGRVQIWSPLIPSSHFDVHLKSLVSLDEIDILGDVHIREIHWRFEGALKYVDWRNAVLMFHLLTPHASFDRLTLALKSLDDEIHCEIYTPIVSLPKAMFTVKGFRALQLGNWHDLRPQLSIGLPFGRYSLSGIYTTPNSTTGGKIHLYFEDGSGSSPEIYQITTEISPLSHFSFNMAQNAGVSLSFQTPIESLPTLDFQLEGKLRGRNVVSVAASGTLNNDSVTFSFDYNNDHGGGPTISAKLSSPLKMYENVALSLSFDTFSRIGTGRSLHMVVQNQEWADEGITLSADYRYQYHGFLRMDGELNAQLVSFMDIPALHFALQTDTDDGFSGELDAVVGSTPASLKVELVQLGEDSSGGGGTLFINGTLGAGDEDDDTYSILVKTNLLRGEEDGLMQFSTEVSLCQENLLVAHFTFSPAMDATGGDLFLATPWGPLHTSLTLIPIFPFLVEDSRREFSIQKVFDNSNLTLDLTFDHERLLGLQFVSRDGVGVFELFNPIAPLSLILSLKRVSKSSLDILAEFCWNLDQPLGSTIGGGINWEVGLLGLQAGVKLQMEKVANLEVSLSHALTSSGLNQSAVLRWNSPLYKSVGESGYQVLVKSGQGSLLNRRRHPASETILQLDLPWRSLRLETSSNNDPDEFVSSLQFSWDVGREESKVIGIKWQEEVRMAWRATEITDFLEINHPLSPLPLTLSSERIYRGGRFQLMEFELNDASSKPENALVVSIFRNGTSWANSRTHLRHRASNTAVGLSVSTSAEEVYSRLSYMGWEGSVRNLTLNLVSKEDDVQLIVSSTDGGGTTKEVLILKNHRYQNLHTLNLKFLSYDLDALFQSTLPFLEVMIKHGGEDRLNIFGGYSHKKKISAHVALVESEVSRSYLFQATAELTPTNALAAKVIWLPDLFSNLLGLKIPTELGSAIFKDLDSTGFLQGVEAELRGRWERQLSPKMNHLLEEINTFGGAEIDLLYQEGVQISNKIGRLIENNTFYLRDILGDFQFFSDLRETLWNVLTETWNTVTDSASNLVSGIQEMYQGCDGRLENLVMDYWKRVEDFVESMWHENMAFASSVFNKLWDGGKILLNLLEGKIQEMEEKLMAVGFFRKLVQLYKDYATWLEEVPFQEFTRKIEAMMNIRIWDRLTYYLEPLLNAIRTGVEDQYFTDLLETPPLPFIRYGLSNIGSTIGKFWQILEIEQRLKDLVRASLSSFDRVLHRYLPTFHWSYDLDSGFILYNQSLSAITWPDFTHPPRWRTPAEEVQDVSQLTNFYYKALDTIESLKPVFDLNLRSILPPFGTYALMAGDHHYFTFDKRYFRFAGECSYLLVADLAQTKDPFSLIVNYENVGGIVRKGSYSVTANHTVVDIEVGGDFKVSVAGRKAELPLHLGTLFIRRHQTGLELYDERGFTMTCSLSFSVCTVGVSGWHFGRLGGLLGTYDNEPSNDFESPDKIGIRDVSAFAYAWRVGRGSGSCRMKNFAKNETELVDSDDICRNLLEKRSSPLRPCFNTVDTQVFMQMCVYDVSRNVNSANRAETACSAFNAYVTECQKNKVDVWMPPTCVRCRLEDGSALTTGENATLQRNGERRPPSSSDNVILLQESSCISSSIVSEAIKRLDLALLAEGLRDNRYAVVGFGGRSGEPHEQPHVKTISAHVWAHNTLFKMPNETSSTTPTTPTFLEDDEDEDNSIEPPAATPSRINLYDAVHYAASLGFRAGVAKNFIAVTCGDEDCGDSLRYADVLTLLVENDIKLHMLVPKEFTLKGNRKDDLVNQIYGMDMNGVYTLKQAAKGGSLDPDPVLKRQINIPKDFCTPLALESNGTRFNVKQATKKVLDVWSRRVAQTSHPSTCQRCECVPDRFGSASIMCHQCVSPSLWKFMEEWKSYQALDGDGEEFPSDLLDQSDFISV